MSLSGLLKMTFIGLGFSALMACSDSPSNNETGQASQAAPEAQAATEAAPADSKPTEVVAPAGQYQIDPNHARVAFSVNHLGLSNYIARFTDYQVIIDLRPDDPSASSVSASIKPASVVTDYVGDYKATHADSPFDSWDEALAQDERFLDAGNHPQITFDSTRVTDLGNGELEIQGDLSMRGQTHPVTLTAQIVGDVAEHPFTGLGAIGFSARGSFDRTLFGMTHLTSPPLVGKQVTLLFEGEFLQMAEETPAAAAE